jgi:hypothetical protein
MTARSTFGAHNQQPQGWSNQDARSHRFSHPGPAAGIQHQPGSVRYFRPNQTGTMRRAQGIQATRPSAPLLARPLPPSQMRLRPIPEQLTSAPGQGFTNFENPVWIPQVDTGPSLRNNNRIQEQPEQFQYQPPGFEQTRVSASEEQHKEQRWSEQLPGNPNLDLPPKQPTETVQLAATEEKGHFGTYYSNDSAFTVPRVPIPRSPNHSDNRQPWIQAMEQTAKTQVTTGRPDLISQ